MGPPDALRPAPASAGRGPRELDLAGRQIGSIATPKKTAPQPIRGEIAGDDFAAAEGVSARAHAPVLRLCRALIEAGFDPNRALHVYRCDVLCLTVDSIGAGARLTVDESRSAFARWKPFSRAAVSPQIARRRRAATLAGGAS